MVVSGSVSGGDAALLYVEGVPVGLTGHALFVAHPAAAGAAVGEDEAVRIHVQDGPVHGRPVKGAGVVAVKPELHHGGVAGHQVVYGVLVFFLVRGNVQAGHFYGAVPGREVDTQVHPVFVAGVAEGLQHILVVHAGLVGHIGRALRIVPEAEAVVVLGGEDHFLEAVLGRHLYPLVHIQLGRRVVFEQQFLTPGGAFAAVVFSVVAGESGLAKVVEHQQLLPVPGNLGVSGAGAERGGGRNLSAGGERQGEPQGRNPFIHTGKLFSPCQG